VVKIIRESVGLTQAGLAEGLGVDVTTVQGWETARRPLTALRTGDFVR
jgi:DNA-binding transcriptional regulator YiaG